MKLKKEQFLKKNLIQIVEITLGLLIILMLGQNCKTGDFQASTGTSGGEHEDPSPIPPTDTTDDSDNEIPYEFALTSVEVHPDSPFGFISSFYPQDRSGIDESGLTGPPTVDLSTDTPSDSPYYSTAWDIGSRWERVSHPVIDWDVVQKSSDFASGTFDWSIPDNFIKNVKQNFHLVINLYTGTSRLEKGTWTFVTVSGAPKQPKDLFITFVKAAVERYDGDGVDDMPGLPNAVKYWQIDNEPSSRALQSDDCTGLACYETASYQDSAGYAKILKTAYEAVKVSDPDAFVIAGGVVQGDPIDDYVYENFWSPLLTQIKNDSTSKYFDIFDFHWFSDWKKINNQYTTYRNKLDEIGYTSTAIWITENGSESGPPTSKGEFWQASDHVKRFLYPMALGVKKIFRAWALVEGWPPFNCGENSMFESTGFIYDGHCMDDKGYGVKKLGYYTYKLMVQQLSNTDWSKISMTSQNDGGAFVVALPQTTGPTRYVAWLDVNDDSTSSLTLEVSTSQVAIVTMVPSASEGHELKAEDFPTFFEKNIYSTTGGLVTIELSSTPVLIVPF